MKTSGGSGGTTDEGLIQLVKTTVVRLRKVRKVMTPYLPFVAKLFLILTFLEDGSRVLMELESQVRRRERGLYRGGTEKEDRAELGQRGSGGGGEVGVWLSGGQGMDERKSRTIVLMHVRGLLWLFLCG